MFKFTDVTAFRVY